MRRESKVKEMSLAAEGHRRISWVQEHMPVLNEVRNVFEKEQPFKGLTVAICLHLEAKTAYLAKVVQAGGADVVITGSNPLSTQDPIAAALVEDGITVYDWHNCTAEEYEEQVNWVLDCEPDLIIDDGGDMVHMLHTSRRELLPKIRGGAEETTTGIHRLVAMEKAGELEFPMVSVNDAYCKYLFDNRYGTGQSTWDGIMRTTNLVVAGTNVVVIGYGWCGKGIAMRAKGLGANVIVTEIDPIKANEAVMDGFRVMPMIEAAKLGDYFVTVTGNINVIRKEHFEVMKDHAIMSNAGHFDCEIDKVELGKMATSVREARHNIGEFTMPDGRKLYLLAEGRLVNLASGDGHPAEIMDMTFALQAMSIKEMNDNYQNLEGKLYPVSAEIDEHVANMRLKSLGVNIDELTNEQVKYLASWKA
ncbi:MAG: adenosylhomocysteinase [Halanaerobiales bacterium]|nr:adenosylhomocysteinase [Halanaerobiales bacterium]